MITGEIKNRIDQIWDTFWTGGITNSMTILEQMTYLFFMKMLDDAQDKKEANARALGIEPDDLIFKKSGSWHNPETDRDIPYADLRWQNFRHEEPAKMFATVRNDVFVFIKNLGEGKQSAYSRYMQSAVFMIQNPRTLVKVVEGIQNLDMTDRDTMGDVYEYILGKMAASGNNGQFRTPRHIIRMMVELMQPQVDWEICDPAMGSAGFIVEAAKYVQDHHRAELMKKANMIHYKTRMFHGFDTDTTMLRIGAMNLMLHGVDAPDVKWQDSLSPENTDSDCYDLILANPPFAGSIDGGNIAKSLLSVSNTKKTELLFLALFVRMLRIGGKCASIVPDGVLFGASTAHQAIRKELVDNQHLMAVISMPSGVFLPYSGVSTAILIFSKTNAGGTLCHVSQLYLAVSPSDQRLYGDEETSNSTLKLGTVQSSSNALALKLQRSMPVIRSEAFAAALLALVAVVAFVLAAVTFVVALAVMPEPERPDPSFWAKRTRVEKNMANVTIMYISAFFT